MEPSSNARRRCRGFPRPLQGPVMPPQYIFQIENLSKSIAKGNILKNIWLSFYPGAKIGVLGLNGAGKSTLLKIMAGVDKEFDGEAIPLTGIKIGFLPQEPHLDPNKSVKQIVEEGLGESVRTIN